MFEVVSVGDVEKVFSGGVGVRRTELGVMDVNIAQKKEGEVIIF